MKSPSYRNHKSRYYSDNSWMWFYFAATAGNEDPTEEEFDRWLDEQDEDDLTAAEEQYRAGAC